MVIKFNKAQGPIKNLTTFELPNFSILTGLNGSGKTQFLKGLSSGNFQIIGVHSSEIAYYSQTDFAIKTVSGGVNTKQTDERFNHFLQVRESENFKFGKTLVDAFETTAFELQRNQRLDLRLLEKEFTDLKEYYIDNQKFSFDSFKIANNSQTYPFLTSFVRKGGQVDDHLMTHYKEKYQNFYNKNRQFLNQTPNEYLNFLQNNVRKDVIEINRKDFETPDILLTDITNSESEYNWQKGVFKFELYKQDIKFSEDDYRRENGYSPVDLINRVLENYDCNGYKLFVPNKEIGFGIPKEQYKSTIQLINSSEEKVHFDSLSSGEKTLIALTLMLFKSDLNTTLPQVLLLDEVDAALHPSMINRLLSVISKHFVEELKIRVILATHSPTTVALAPAETIYAVSSLNEFKISPIPQADAIEILTEGFAILTQEESSLSIRYNVLNTEKPVLFTEGITDKIILETAWEKLYGKTEMPFYINETFGADFLKNLFLNGDGIFFRDYPNKKFIALFDFDRSGFNGWNGLARKYETINDNPYEGLTKKHSEYSAFAALLPVPKGEIEKQVIKFEYETFKDESLMEIEHLFFDADKTCFRHKEVPGGAKVIELAVSKSVFVKKMKSFPKKSFSNFIRVFENIDKILSAIK